MTNAPKYAPADDRGLLPYVQTKTQFGRETHRIVRASSLAEAKRNYSSTSELHVRCAVRRATIADTTEYPED